MAKGADVKFKAIKSPSSAKWPYGEPVWSGSSGVKGIGEEKMVAFNTASSNPTDYKVVQVECGNTVAVNVVVVDLSKLVINANRVSDPNESSFPVRSGKHFEVNGVFRFDLMLNSWPAPVKLYSEVWDLDWLNEIFAMGSGSSITVNYLDAGTCKTRFFFDNNTSGDSYTGWDDPYKDTPTFEARNWTTHGLTFAKTTIAENMDYASACTVATHLIVRKDTADDYRAIACFYFAGHKRDIPATDDSGVTHDPVKVWYKPADGSIDDRWGHLAYFGSATSADVVIVDEIVACDEDGNPFENIMILGICTSPKIIIWDQFLSGRVLIHELGHSYGLRHKISNADMVMFPIVNRACLLEAGEADEFE